MNSSKVIDLPARNSYNRPMTKPLSPKTVSRIMRRIAQGKANDVNPTTLCKAMSAMGKASGARKVRDENHYKVILPAARAEAARKRKELQEAEEYLQKRVDSCNG